MRAFERLHSADGLRFEIRSEIPLARGLGSSAAAIVAGLVAADHLFELGLERDEIYRHAVELEGHPTTSPRPLYGGFVRLPAPTTVRRAAAAGAPEPPEGVEAVLVIPDETVPTAEARAALPAAISVSDTVANVAAATQLVLGLERSDLDPDRSRPRRPPPSAGPPAALRALDGAARQRRGSGAIGATISVQGRR